MGHCVLLIPVPALEVFVRARWQHYEPSWVSRDPAFTHAHVTVLAPFVPEPSAADLAAVAHLAATTAPFDVVLDEVAAFPDGTLHVVPDPRTPFDLLTERACAAFPGLRPYDGAFDDVVPHVTLDHTAGGASVASVAAALDDLLPVTTRAERLEVHHYGPGECRVLASWPLTGATVTARSAPPRRSSTRRPRP